MNSLCECEEGINNLKDDCVTFFLQNLLQQNQMVSEKYGRYDGMTDSGIINRAKGTMCFHTNELLVFFSGGFNLPNIKPE